MVCSLPLSDVLFFFSVLVIPQDNACGAKGRAERGSHGGEEDVLVRPTDRLRSGLDGGGGGQGGLQVKRKSESILASIAKISHCTLFGRQVILHFAAD